MEIEPEVLECMEDMITKVVRKESKRKWAVNNKEYSKQYREKNKEYQKVYHKEYQQTPRGIKSNKISQWKYQGVMCDNWNALYEHYLKTSYCDFCRCELTYDRYSTATTKCVDHDHTITDRPNFRNILCQSCNVKRK